MGYVGEYESTIDHLGEIAEAMADALLTQAAGYWDCGACGGVSTLDYILRRSRQAGEDATRVRRFVGEARCGACCRRWTIRVLLDAAKDPCWQVTLEEVRDRASDATHALAQSHQ